VQARPRQCLQYLVACILVCSGNLLTVGCDDKAESTSGIERPQFSADGYPLHPVIFDRRLRWSGGDTQTWGFAFVARLDQETSVILTSVPIAPKASAELESVELLGVKGGSQILSAQTTLGPAGMHWEKARRNGASDHAAFNYLAMPARDIRAVEYVLELDPQRPLSEEGVWLPYRSPEALHGYVPITGKIVPYGGGLDFIFLDTDPLENSERSDEEMSDPRLHPMGVPVISRRTRKVLGISWFWEYNAEAGKRIVMMTPIAAVTDSLKRTRAEMSLAEAMNTRTGTTSEGLLLTPK
jgi:hypothetical protein